MSKVKGINYDQYVVGYESGLTVEDLAEQAGVNPTTMYRCLVKRGVKFRSQGTHGVLTPRRRYVARKRSVDYAEVISVYLSGKSLSQTAETMKISVGVVRNAMRVNGIALRSVATVHRKTRKYGQNKGKPLLARRRIDYELVLAKYTEGKSLLDIAKEISANPETIRKALHAMGVKLRSRGLPQGRSNGGSFELIGGFYVAAYGYVVKRRDFPGDADGLEHRLIAERILGRPLKEDEVVHHVNRNRADNRNRNLLICTKKYHMELHARMRKHPYWSTLKPTSEIPT